MAPGAFRVALIQAQQGHFTVRRSERAVQIQGLAVSLRGEGGIAFCWVPAIPLAEGHVTVGLCREGGKVPVDQAPRSLEAADFHVGFRHLDAQRGNGFLEGLASTLALRGAGIAAPLEPLGQLGQPFGGGGMVAVKIRFAHELVGDQFLLLLEE